VGDKSQFTYYGSSNCQRCHFGPIQQDFDEGRTYFLRMDESSVWQLHDRHSKAFKLLECERGQAMGRSLGWNVTNDQRCLGCHANWQADRPNPGVSILSEGVACEACHGPSSKYINDHSLPKWRAIPLATRSADYGMLMLRDPLVRGQVCLSCHIGSAAEGKVITHEMYAAGHPPLPSFELRNFDESMKHWSDLPDQLAKLDKDHPPHADETRRNLEFIRSQLGEDAATQPALKTALTGAILTLRQSTQLLADEAVGKVNHPQVENKTLPLPLGEGSGEGTTPEINNSVTKTASPPSAWPEFALYDCAMCHHDLRYPAWRQVRSDGSPGRPQIPRWPQALVDVAIAQAAGSDQAAAARLRQEFAARLNDLNQPFLRQPFANPTEIAKPAAAMTNFLDNLLGQLAKTKFNTAASLTALKQLSLNATTTTPDYDSARQFAWAFQSIWDELNKSGATPSLSATTQARINSELDVIKAELQLRLNSLKPDVKDVCSQAISPGELQSALDCAAGYSPQQFQQHMRAIGESLSAGRN
ncbi:MAG TPA: multiheme c-type cytochrome, partial [Pirellulales bacterium]